MKPIIKWSGGKYDELKFITKYIPQNINTYIEPFVGGGALFFHLKHSKNVINDTHKELVSFYSAIKDGNSKMIYDFMVETPNDEETYYKVRDDECINEASRFYYLRKTCYRGMMRYNKNGKFNVPFGKYKTISYKELLEKSYNELLKNTLVCCGDFEEVIKKYSNDENNFIFLDPPYDSKFTDYGYSTFTKKDHLRLYKCFISLKCKCLMVIGYTEFIYGLYKDYIVDTYDKKYKFKLHSNRIGDEINNKHLVIANYKQEKRNIKQLINDCEYITNCKKNKQKDVNSISYLVDAKLSQSDCIKLGIALEKIYCDVIMEYSSFKLQNIKDKNIKSVKEKDHLFINHETKNVYFAELKSNLNLDTEKSKQTFLKCLKIVEELKNLYGKDYTINWRLVCCRYLSREDIPKCIISKYSSIQDNVAGINDYFDFIGVKINFTIEEHKKFINDIVEKMFI